MSMMTAGRCLLLLALMFSADGLHVPPKRHWKIGIYSRRYSSYQSTFETYLNKEVGPLFAPNITFELVGADTSENIIEGSDFAFLDPLTMACVSSGSRWTGIATQCTGFGTEQCTTEIGATIFTRKNDTSINSLRDLKNKKVGIFKTSYFQSFMIPQQELLREGLVLFADSAQVQAKTGSLDAYLDVMSGALDAALVSSGKLEELALAGSVNLSEIKILNLQNSSSTGDPFPFKLSTRTFPGLTLAYSGDLDGKIVASEMVTALFRINSSSPAAIAGDYFRWLPPASTTTVHESLEDIGVLTKDKKTGKRACDLNYRSNYDGITCPDGYFKHLEHIASEQCENVQLACPPDRECFCKPCRKAKKVEVAIGGVNCMKMQVCHNTTQLSTIEVLVNDNLLSALPVTYIFNAISSKQLPTKSAQQKDTNFTYEFQLSSSDIGFNTLQVFLGGEEIESSPTLIHVHPKECAENEEPNADGICINMKEVMYYATWSTWCVFASFIFNVVLSVSCAIWTLIYRNTKIVYAAQAPFLLLICLGCAISSGALLFLQFDDNPDHPLSTSTSCLDFSCTAGLWFYGVGFCLTASALRAKLVRAKRLTVDVARNGKRTPPKIYRFLWIVARTLMIEVILLTVWTVVDAPSWNRYCIENTTGVCTSIGSCSGDPIVSLGFFLCLSILHISYLIYLLFISYQVRFVPQEFAEHKWVTAASISSLEVHILTPLLASLVWNSMNVRFLVVSLALFYNDLSILLMVFLPKMKRLHWEESNEKTLCIEDQLHHLRRQVRNVERKSGSSRNYFLETSLRPQKEKELLKENLRLKLLLKKNGIDSGIPPDYKNPMKESSVISHMKDTPSLYAGTEAKMHPRADSTTASDNSEKKRTCVGFGANTSTPHMSMSRHIGDGGHTATVSSTVLLKNRSLKSMFKATGESFLTTDAKTYQSNQNINDAKMS